MIDEYSMQCRSFRCPAVWVLRPSPFLKNVSGRPGAPKPNGRERRFPVFARLVAAFPEIPEESKTAHFGSASPAGTRLAKPPVSPLKTSCSTLISLADCYQNHPHESTKTPLLSNRRSGRYSSRPERQSQKKFVRARCDRMHHRARSDSPNSFKSAQFALQSVGVVPMTEAKDQFRIRAGELPRGIAILRSLRSHQDDRRGRGPAAPTPPAR